MVRSLFETRPTTEATSFWDRFSVFVPQSKLCVGSRPAEQDNLEFARKAEHLDARRQQDLLIVSVGVTGLGRR